MSRTIFITGTDTNVGKTVLTSLLICHLRQQGSPVLALKPFCTGSHADARILHSLQDPNSKVFAGKRITKDRLRLTLDDVNPFFFPEPLAPLVAARIHRRRIPLSSVVAHIRKVVAQFRLRSPPGNQFVLIEGVGGLLVPLGPGYSVLDLIRQLKCEVLVVARNRLGSINHTLLTVRTLQAVGIQQVKVVLIGVFQSRFPHRASPLRLHAALSNPRIMAELLAPTPLFQLPFLGRNPLKTGVLEKNVKKMKKTLARILT